MNVEEYRTYEDAFLMVINEGFFDLHGYKLTCQKKPISILGLQTIKKENRYEYHIISCFADIPE